MRGPLCDAYSADLWFPPRFHGPAFDLAVSVCRRCPVQTDCLTTALKAESGEGLWIRSGIFGGLTPAQRFDLDPTVTRTRQPAGLRR